MASLSSRASRFALRLRTALTFHQHAVIVQLRERDN